MNNPLTVISGRAQLLTSMLKGERQRAAAAAIAEAAQDLADLISSLRLIADPPAPCLENVPIDAVIEAAVARAEDRTGVRGRVSVNVPKPGPSALIDRELIATALSEAIRNGIEAGPDSPVEVRVEPGPGDDRLMIAVVDKGAGMSARTLQHAFDPFFSDKPAGRQTGLGLTRARRLVELHHGELRLQSTQGAGTTALFTLPAGRADAKAA
jgi:signal transduction histidine kinase